MGLRLDGVTLSKGGFSLSADVEIASGQRVAVIGPSGAGKSTLFDGIAGFLTPLSGRILWNDAPLEKLDPGQRPIAMLFQDNNLFPHLTVGQNVALGMTHKRRLTSEQTAKTESVLARVGLEGFSLRKISQLSGGQISRVALARVLLQNRPVWLLDEPFAALGPGLKRDMLGLVSDVAQEAGVTVLMITHDPNDALGFAETSLLVSDGAVRGPLETTELLAAPPEALRTYLGT